MAKGMKTGGRQKGTPNKMATRVKEALEHVYDAIGGDEAFAAWAKTEPTEFYKLYAKLLPKDINTTLNSNDELARRLQEARERIGR